MESVKLPEKVRLCLGESEIDPETVRAIARSDLSILRAYEESWVIVTEGCLAIVGDEGVRESFPLEELEDLEAENLATSGVLTAKLQDRDRLLCRFSNTQLKGFSRLTRIASKLKKNEELTPEDLFEADSAAVCPKCGLQYPDANRRVCPKCTDRRAIFARLLGYFPKHRKAIVVILLMMTVQAGLELIGPYLSGRILYDEVLSSEGRYHGAVGSVILLMLLIRLAAIGASVVYGRQVARISAQVIFTVKTEIFAALQKLSMSFYGNKQTGALMNRVDYDALQLEFFFVDGVPFFIVNVLVILGISATMFLLNWQLALLVFVPTPFIIIITKRLIPRVWNLYTRRYRSRRILTSIVNDSLTGVRVVKSFGKEHQEIGRFTSANSGLYSANMLAQRMSATVFPAIYVVLQIGGFIVWAFGGWSVVQGNVSFGVLMSFVGYIAMFYRPMQWFTRLLDWWSHCMNSAQRIFEILDTVPDIADATDCVHLASLKGKIEVNNVTFSYEPNKPVIHDISFEIEPGEMIGLVGHTGAGKSTITNLVTRLYEIEQGAIKIDGIDVRQIMLADLRANIGIVLQQTYLFTGTIAENIAYGKPEAGRPEIIRAAEAASAHDFIVKLPNGYDTLLGRAGQDLSGGERQRLAIARAILKDPRVLIFDEATSSVDTETEEKIQLAIEHLIRGRTTIAIAHRLSTLRKASRLIVLDQGKIIEFGTHDELVRNKGKYHELVSREQKALKVIGVAE